MTDDLDIYRSAMLLIDQHGQHASLEAAMRGDELLAQDDLDGQRVWMAIRDAVRELQQELQRERSGDGEAVH